jgi:hypothetical protein
MAISEKIFYRGLKKREDCFRSDINKIVSTEHIRQNGLCSLPIFLRNKYIRQNTFHGFGLVD